MKNNFEQFVANAYNTTGQQEPYEEVASTLNQLGGLINKDTNAFVIPAAREAIWRHSTEPLRQVIAIGSISLGGLIRGQVLDSMESLFYRKPVGLATIARNTDSGGVIAKSMVAAGRHAVSTYDNMTRDIVPWAAMSTKFADEKQLQEIANMMRWVSFSHYRTDSSESEDPHYVDVYLQDETLPLPFRRSLLWGAYADTSRSTYKSWVWQEQIRGTLTTLALSDDNGLRFDARRIIGLPESDEQITEMKERSKTQARESQGMRIADNERKLDTIVDQAKEIISSSASRSS